MKIVSEYVRHYMLYDISILSLKEREELSKLICLELDDKVLGIIKANETEDSKWLKCYNRTINQVSVKTILKS